MIKEITGLHHITSMASNADANNVFFTKTLGLRRVKKTVNFDAPEVYHLYYGDEIGTPGSIMTYFPFAKMSPGKRGAGEVSITEFAVPKDALGFWKERLSALGVSSLMESSFLGEKRLSFDGPDGDGFALVESDLRDRTPWAEADVPEDAGILGFQSYSRKLVTARMGGISWRC